MNIKHPSLFNTDKVAELYSKKDGVPVSYVCTTDLQNSDQPLDIFYRETPHPEFGNKYFGLRSTSDDRVLITNADIVEDYEFGMIQNKDGDWHYSSCHHDCLFIDGKMIDGGRAYIRSTGLDGIFKVKNGEFVNVES
jgi:hypothetical protein|tara:strand:- start:1042 stop:1452 length:411 start_codon:yes stop_codon:yes gene_type:complete